MVYYYLYQGGRRLIFPRRMKPVFADNNLCFILFFRYDLCIYGGSKERRGTFVPITLQSLALYLSH